MRYEYNLIIRLILSFIPLNAFLFIFTPLTIYGSYLALFYYHPVVDGLNLIAGGEIFTFVAACVAALAYMLLWLLIMLTKDISVLNRIKMFLFGSLLIYLMNILRIFILVYVSLNYGTNLFDKIHILFWDFTASIFVALVWIFLINFYKIKSIPIYSDFMHLYKKSVFRK